jgi:hypothetical protein
VADCPRNDERKASSELEIVRFGKIWGGQKTEMVPAKELSKPLLFIFGKGLGLGVVAVMDFVCNFGEGVFDFDDF